MRTAVGLLLGLSVGLAALAQSAGGTFVGHVLDPTGAAIPNGQVTARNVDTGQALETSTTAAGEYSIRSVPAGRYTITAQVPGFKTGIAKDVVMEPGGTLRAEFTLQVGSLAQQVEVTAYAELQSESATVESLVRLEQVLNLPLAERATDLLVFLTPHAVDNTLHPDYDFGAFALAGNRSYSNEFQLDGLPSNNTFQARSAFNISLDAIREFKVLAANSPAEYGQAGAQIIVATKSGTNRLQGSLYEFQRGNQWRARNPFNTLGTQSYQRNQFGGSLGGPVRRNTTFFFVNYEGIRQYQTETRLSALPSAAMWNGDFSELLGRGIQLRDPLATGRPVIPGNRLDTYLKGARISQTALKLRPFFTTPSQAGTNNTLNFPESSVIGDQFTARVDQHLPFHSTLSVRATYANQGGFTPNLVGVSGVGYREPYRSRNGSLTLKTVLTPRVVNEFRFGAMNFSDIVHYDGGGLPTVESLGLKGFDNAAGNNLIPPLPRIVFSGTDALTPAVKYGPTSAYGETALSMINNVYTWNDTLSRQAGPHSLRTGLEIRRTILNVLQQNNARGQLTFTGSPSSSTSSGYSFADFLLGLPASTQELALKPKVLLRQTEIAGFVQDDWKAAARLTLNIGLRYELFVNPYEDRDRISNFDPVTGAIVVPSRGGRPPVSEYNQAVMARLTKADGTYTFPLLTDEQARFTPRRLASTDTNNIGPRFGFAWLLERHTVVRGGYGIFYTRYPRQYLLQTMLVNPPFAGLLSYSQKITNNVPLLTLAAPYASTGSASVSPVGLQENFMLSDNQEWNLTIQREIGWRTVLTLGYIGNKGTHLFRTANLNAAVPDPQQPGKAIRAYQSTAYGSAPVSLRTTDADSIYHSMRVEARKMMDNGLAFQGNWTWAKGLDDTGANVNSPIMDIENRGRDRADSDYVRRHVVGASATYQLPLGKGRRFLRSAGGWRQALVGGWNMGGIWRYQTGMFLTPSFTSTATNPLSNSRPDRVLGVSPNLPADQRRTQRWFNPAAFMPPVPIDPATGALRYGNTARNVILGPGLNTLDLSLYKTFTIRAGKSDRPKRLTLRLEAFNVLNHPNFSNPSTNLGTPDPANPMKFIYSSTVGNITSVTVPMRQAQLGVRFDF